MVIENVGGGGGSIAAARVARAAPDGYTVEIGNNGSNMLVGALYALPVDIIKDFAPVARAYRQSADHRQQKDSSGREPERVVGLAQGQSEHRLGRHRRARRGSQRGEFRNHDRE